MKRFSRLIALTIVVAMSAAQVHVQAQDYIQDYCPCEPVCPPQYASDCPPVCASECPPPCEPVCVVEEGCEAYCDSGYASYLSAALPIGALVVAAIVIELTKGNHHNS